MCELTNQRKLGIQEGVFQTEGEYSAAEKTAGVFFCTKACKSILVTHFYYEAEIFHRQQNLPTFHWHEGEWVTTRFRFLAELLLE